MKRLCVFLTLMGLALQASLALAYSGKPLLLTSGFPAANTYYIAYYDFLSITAGVAVPANSYLQFDEFIPADSAVQSGSLDFVFSGGSNPNLRDYQTPTGQYIRDQNYLRAHPFSDLSAYAKGQWYTRKFDMGALGAAGKTFYEVCLSTDTGNNSNGAPANLAGSFNGYFDNIHFTNAYGVVLRDLYSSNGALGLPGSPSQSSTKFTGAGAATALSNVVAAVGSLSLAAAPASATVGQTITLTATLDDAAGAGIPYANLELAANRAQDLVSATKGRTNASGSLTTTVTSLVAGASGASTTGGPFSASASYTFVAAAPLSWSVGTAGQTLVIGPGSTALAVEAVDAYGNLTSSARIVKVSVADANLQLSLDNSTWTAASTGVTLSPGAGVGTVYAKILSGGYRSNTLQAADAGGSGAALAGGSATVVINPSAAASVTLSLPASGVAGVPLALSATALDLSSQAANSGATLSFSATNPSASFSTDSGNTWGSTASLALANGFATLLYRDTAAGASGLSVSSTLGPASTSTTILAGAPALISGTASPDNIYNSASAGTPKTSTLSGFVFDAYGNPVSNTAVSFFLITAQGSLTSNPVSVNSNAAGAASTVYTAGGATSANYIRVSAAGLKPWLLNVQATTPTKLNLSPNPATAGVSVPVQFTLLAQDGASPAITGYSTTSVALNSNSGNVQFSASPLGPWSQPSLLVNLSAGTAVVYALVSAPGYETITATDQAGAGALTTGTANLYVPQASLALLSVSSPVLNVSRGQAGCTLVYTVQNAGGTDCDLVSETPTFNGSAANFTVSPAPGNPSVVPAGATLDLTFTVTVGAAAPLGSVTLSGSVSGTDASTHAALNDNGGGAAHGNWIVAGVPTQLRVYAPGGTPAAGSFFGVTVVALDAANNTCASFASPLLLTARLDSAPGTTCSAAISETAGTFTNGVSILGTYLTLAGVGVNLRGDAGGISGNSVGMTPVAGALAAYDVFNGVTALLGQPFAVTITAVDAWGNTTAGSTTVNLTPTPLAGSGILSVVVKNLSSGFQAFFNEAYNLSQTIRIFASDGTVTSSLAATTPIAIISQTYTQSPTFTITPTYTASPTVTPSFTASQTFTITKTSTVSPTFSASPTVTPTYTASSTFTASPTSTATQTGTDTASPTSTYTASPTKTFTASPTSTFTASPTMTPTATKTSTYTASPTSTFTVSPTSTFTASPTPTFTASPSLTASPSFSASPTASPTGTISPTLSATATFTASPTETETLTATPSYTASPTLSPTPTASPTRTASPSITPSFTPVAQASTGLAYPNPFWPLRGMHMTLVVGVSTPGQSSVKVYSLAGDLVKVLASGSLPNGSVAVTWDGTNSSGDTVASGMYLVLVQAPGLTQTRLVGVLK